MDVAKQILLTTLFAYNVGVFCDRRDFFRGIPIEGDNVEEDDPDWLILTPMIEKGEIEGARNASRVLPIEGDGGIVSYSGFFTVKNPKDSHLFFWFFPSLNNPKTDPVTLWLQGDPGSTLYIGLFEEHGPFLINSNSKLSLREYTWVKNCSMIYIDYPEGIGYSITDDGYATNQTAVGNDLYNALIQFFQLFPDFQGNEFYVAGQSYGGKYATAIAYTIHDKNKNSTTKINLQGIAIGSGWVGPEYQCMIADFLYHIGLIDSNTQKFFLEKQATIQHSLKTKDWHAAFLTRTEMFKSMISSLYDNETGLKEMSNFLSNSEMLTNNWEYVQTPEIRRALHVGSMTFNSSSEIVSSHLVLDFMKSVKTWLEVLVENYRVLFYNGQLDVLVPYTPTVSFLKTLDWSGAGKYKNASRFTWKVGNDVAGYVKTAGNLTEILVRNAGHLVPSDQPSWAFDLFNRFLQNKPFHEGNKY